MNKITRIDYIVHHLYGLDKKRAQTVGLVDKLVRFSVTYGKEASRLFILELNDFYRLDSASEIRDYFEHGLKLVDAFSQYCCHLFLGCPEEYSKGRSLFNIFTRKTVRIGSKQYRVGRSWHVQRAVC